MAKNYFLASIAIIAFSILLSLYFYPQLPDSIATHWGFNGEVNGHMPKLEGIALLPIISILIFFGLVYLPRLDPLKGNYKHFEGYYSNFIILIASLLTYIQALVIFWNLGYLFNLAQWSFLGMGILIYYTGVLLKNSKRNWFIGIRTPWTLSSDKVWDKTHKFGGRLFEVIGPLTFIGSMISDKIAVFFLVSIIAASIGIVIYSYAAYRKEKIK